MTFGPLKNLVKLMFSSLWAFKELPWAPKGGQRGPQGVPGALREGPEGAKGRLEEPKSTPDRDQKLIDFLIEKRVARADRSGAGKLGVGARGAPPGKHL